MQTVIVFLIVALAGFFVGRIFYRGFTRNSAGACGCTCCSLSDSCSDPTTSRMDEGFPGNNALEKAGDQNRITTEKP